MNWVSETLIQAGFALVIFGALFLLGWGYFVLKEWWGK